MSGLWRAARAELGAVFGDKAVLVVIIGGSLFYALFYPLPYRAQVASDLPVAIVDHDGSALSRQLVRWIDATEQLQVVANGGSLAEARAAVRRKELAGYIEIPEGFERRVLRGEPARVGAFANAAYMVLFSQVANGTVNAAMAMNAELIERRQLGAARSPQLAASLAAPVVIDLRELYNPDGGYANYVVPAVLVLILQQTFLIGICMVQVSRRGDPLAPIGIGALLGRALVYLVLQLLIFAVYLLVVYRLFGFPHQGAPGLALLALLPGFLAVSFLGMALGSLFLSRETALQVMMLVSVPALFLAGFAWPAEAMPPALVALGQLLPSTGGIDVFVRVYQMGAGLADIRSVWAGQWLLAAAFLVLAVCAERRAPTRRPVPSVAGRSTEPRID